MNGGKGEAGAEMCASQRPIERGFLFLADSGSPALQGRGGEEASAGGVDPDGFLARIDGDPAIHIVVAPVEVLAAPTPLRELDWRIAAGRSLRVVLIVGPDQLDLAGGSLGYPWVDYVHGVAGTAEMARSMDAVRQAFAAPDGRPTLDELGEEAARIAHALSKLAAQLPLATHRAVDADLDPASVRRLIRLRRMRDGFFPAELFADPAWDILLDLTAARLEGIAVSVSSLCIAAAVPTTTGLRWIKGMVERGLLLREPDPVDGRRVLISLCDATFDRMIECLSLLRREGAVV